MASPLVFSEPEPEEFSELLSSLQEIRSKVGETSLVAEQICKLFCDPFSEKGLSFLDMKYHVLLQYIIDLTLLMTRKVNGRQIETEPVVDRLVESRTVLEKTRPIDVKLKYIVNKYLKTSTGQVGDAALSFRPNPDSMMANEKEEEQTEEGTTEAKGGVYVPPKITAVPYEDVNFQSKKAKLLERSRKRALNSSILRDLRDEYSEQPEEISDGYRGMKLAKIRNKEETREKFEEENLMRLPTTKKERQMARLKGSGLTDLSRFDTRGLKAFHRGDAFEEEEEELENYGRSRKMSKKGQKKNKKFKGMRRKRKGR